MPRPIPDEKEIEALVGYEFPGGTYKVDHWENFLLTECTGASPLPNSQVHPVVLFHMPILGANTTIGEMFEVGMAETDFSIGIESYDWEMFQTLYEDVEYSITAKITEADRRTNDTGHMFDRIQFQFSVADPDGKPAARTTITWTYRRGIS